MQRAQVDRSTTTLFRAHSATRAGGMPSLSHFVRRVFRSSYAHRPVGESNMCGVARPYARYATPDG